VALLQRGEGDEGRRQSFQNRGRNQLIESARILALMDVAIADAIIGCWDAKYTYPYWRPITARPQPYSRTSSAPTRRLRWRAI
jgi:hypothetical protein